MNVARYLIPTSSEIWAAPEYAAKAKSVLFEMEVISEDPEGYTELFCNGARSTQPFQTEPEDEEYGFEVAEVFGGPGFIIAPIEYVNEASCPRCTADMTEIWAPKMRGEDGLPVHYNSPVVQISCPKCGAAFRLEEAKSGSLDKFYMTDRYVSFWNSHPFKPEWIAEFERQMGCHHETFDYWWT